MFSHRQKGVISVSGLEIGKNNESFIKSFESLGIEFWFNVFGELRVSLFNGSSGSPTRQL